MNLPYTQHIQLDNLQSITYGKKEKSLSDKIKSFINNTNNSNSGLKLSGLLNESANAFKINSGTSNSNSELKLKLSGLLNEYDNASKIFDSVNNNSYELSYQNVLKAKYELFGYILSLKKQINGNTRRRTRKRILL